jgi:hypothetical protein
VARWVLDPDGRRVRDLFKMPKWFSDKETRKTYFGRIDYIIGEFSEGSVQPSDAFIQNMLAQMVEGDGAFESHVLKRNAANPDWKLIRCACAGMILEAHIKAVEEGTWPEKN